MKLRFILTAALLIVAGAFLVPAKAEAGCRTKWQFNISCGGLLAAPSVCYVPVAPQPVYYAPVPAPAYQRVAPGCGYAPAPYVVAPPAYYAPAPVTYYTAPSVGFSFGRY